MMVKLAMSNLARCAVARDLEFKYMISMLFRECVFKVQTQKLPRTDLRVSAKILNLN